MAFVTVRAQHYLDWCWIVVINVMWATQVPVIKWIGDRLGPVTIAFVPMIASTVLFLPPLLRSRPRSPRRDVRHFFIAGLFGLSFYSSPTRLGRSARWRPTPASSP